MLDLNVYGETPAAMYLARTLNELSNKTLTRSIGRKIHGTSTYVNELVMAYESGYLSPKTVANTLRLMREEVTGEYFSQFDKQAGLAKTPERLVDQLQKNVRIGYIKRGIRLATIARKGERVMANPEQRGILEDLQDGDIIVKFRDNQSGQLYDVGIGFDCFSYDTHPPQLERIYEASGPCMSDINDITPELLRERSERRCKRLKKAHTL